MVHTAARQLVSEELQLDAQPRFPADSFQNCCDQLNEHALLPPESSQAHTHRGTCISQPLLILGFLQPLRLDGASAVDVQGSRWPMVLVSVVSACSIAFLVLFLI